MWEKIFSEASLERNSPTSLATLMHIQARPSREPAHEVYGFFDWAIKKLTGNELEIETGSHS